MKKILALLLSMILLISGMAFADSGAIVAQIGERQITRAELDAAYEVSYGDYALDDGELLFELRLELLDRMLEEEAEKIMQAHFGCDVHTENELALAAEEAALEYQGLVEYYASMLDDGTMSHDELHAAAEAHLASLDLSPEVLTQQAISALAGEKLRAQAIGDLSLDEDAIRAAYAAMVEDDRAMNEAFPDNILSCALYGIPYLYVPEGVREIKQIVVSFDADQLIEYAFLSDAIAQGVDAKADLDALYAQLDGRVNEILNQLASGKSFEAVEEEYSDDWAMLESGMEEARYFVLDGADIWDPAFTAAALALEQPGQISDPVRMSDGVHILCYYADVPAGAVAYEEVRDYVAEYALYQVELDAYNAALEQWMEDLGAQIFLDALN